MESSLFVKRALMPDVLAPGNGTPGTRQGLARLFTYLIDEAVLTCLPQRRIQTRIGTVLVLWGALG